MKELVPGRIGEGRKDGCMDRVALSFVVHDCNVAELRNTGPGGLASEG
jgi:hypothetical protein